MIGAAVVGLGWWGRNVEESLRDSDVIRPVLGVDPDAAGRQAFTDRGIHTSSDLRDALDDPRVDAVVLCTPHRMHTTQVIAEAILRSIETGGVESAVEAPAYYGSLPGSLTGAPAGRHRSV
jgi:predicted dehydrogenase